MLYAAICSGKNTKMLSNDSMEDHKLAIGEDCRPIFELWQQEHQYGYSITKDRKLEIFRPKRINTCTHKNGDFWYFPFKSNEDAILKTWNQYEVPRKWACIRLEKIK